MPRAGVTRAPAPAPDAAVTRPLETLDAGAVRRWSRRALEGLTAAREEIDGLNVYPVPDGDTGTNLLLTVEAADEALDGVPADADLPATAAALAHGALVGARGNSGVILSQLLRGVARALGRPEAVDGPALAAALSRSVDTAYAAVARPVEGTVLTVARAAAGAATAAAAASGTLVAVVRAAAAGARDALDRTPAQLDVLRRAGVVDAGGAGLCVVLDALEEVVTGARRQPAHWPPTAPVVDGTCAEPAASGPAYEVMYLLEAADDDVPALRAALDETGDSVVVVGGEGLWNVHVHADDVGAAIEAGVAAGRPYRIRVTRFADADTTRTAAGSASAGGGPGADTAGRAVVAVAAGDGLGALLAGGGATVVPGRPGRRPSAGELLAAVHGAGRREVVLLPNSAASRDAADTAAREARQEGHRVAVVPAVATVQALAALAVHDPSRRFDDDAVAMTAAARHCRHGAVTVAARDAWTMAGACRAGDVLGVVDGDFAVIGTTMADTAVAVVDRMLAAGGDLVTLVTGAGAEAGLVEAVAAHVAAARPEVETVVHAGGQPRYPLLIGVE